ncbi:T9SS type A sorting domain-containing protein [Nonlabens marinus]|nr:T9SS type A sorting domain-containing protein [Nonlabens marinus]
MKKFALYSVALALIAFIIYLIIPKEQQLSLMEQKRQKHEKFLADSPFNDTKNLSSKERRELGLPPNAYNERMWELTMNPDLGYPTPFLVEPTKFPLSLAKGTPGTVTSPWIERGPLNVGGRTRVVFFDPNDVGANNGDGVDYNRVFAGAVGGGLWVNENINNVIGQWKIVPGIAANLSVSAYAIDPNDSNTIYIGTGEQYTDGAAIGDGLYKSTDGGATWAAVDIPVAGGGDFQDGSNLFQAGIFHINDILTRDVNGTTEVYVGVGASRYFSPNFTIRNPLNFLGSQSAGIYRSADNGATWSRNEDFNLKFFTTDGTFPVVPNDFELAADGKIYMSTIHSPGFGAGGGRIYSTTNGTSWTLLQNVNGNRTELAASKTNANKLYVLASVSGEAEIFKTLDGFLTIEDVEEPQDADNGIPDSDFTRGQSFYDLVIEVAPNNDETIYVGGINIHRSEDGGAVWQQISKWSENPNMNLLQIPFVHADVHALTFQPNNNDRALIGSDGGVSLASAISQAGSNSNAIQTRNNGYNVTQFYYGDINQIDFEDGDDFIGGTQDNGSPVINNSVIGNGLSSSFDPTGGDGSFSAIDDEGVYAILGYTSRTHIYLSYPINNNGSRYFISNENDGDFINVGELDSAFDVFYANSRTAGNQNSITACELGASSANCTEITGGEIANGRPTAMKASPFSTVSPTLYVGSQDSRLFRIDNANSTANSITSLSSPDFLGSVSDIEFGASELEIFLTMHNYGVNNVWYTNDGGVTWSQKDGNLPDIPVKAILQNPLVANEVIIGTQNGIYATTDFDSPSPTWVQTMNGMTSVPVYDLDLRTADNTVLATTHGRGMFTGKFDGTTASITNDIREKPIKIFPTQASTEIFVDSNRDFGNTLITIYNLNGQQVYKANKSLSGSKQRIDISALSTGFYLLKVTGDGINQTTKFLKE